MDNTKDTIIEEAYKLFLNHSYEAVSISDISKATGFTKGALYHHFASKEDLFKSVVDKYLYMTEVEAELETISLDEFIQISILQTNEAIKKFFSGTVVFSPISYLSLFIDAYRHYPGFAEAKDTFIFKEIEKTKWVLENAIKLGEIRSDINTSLIAANIYSINLGLVGNLVRTNSIEDTITLLKDQTNELYRLLKKQ